ncbi:MAG: hypothetical protein EXR79_15690 [Myxococcales bacterium]|nr:hypothetical protein [Myxococcales bacterium]
MSSRRTNGATVAIDEGTFRDLAAAPDQFDLIVLIDGDAVLLGQRNVREDGVQGPFSRATSHTWPKRPPTDAHARVTSARTMAHVMRASAWVTASEAFAGGNPDREKPAETSARADLHKGRKLIDLECAHEVWVSFALEPAKDGKPARYRFRPGAPEAWTGKDPVVVGWCLAWSEALDVPDAATAPVLAPFSHDPATPAVRVDVLGLTVLLRDLVVDPATCEVALLLDLEDWQDGGPYRIDGIGLRDGFGDIDGLHAREQPALGPRFDVPGHRVERVRARPFELARGAHRPLLCVSLDIVDGLVQRIVEAGHARMEIHVTHGSGESVRRVVDMVVRVATH